jgi:hypothetical protein
VIGRNLPKGKTSAITRESNRGKRKHPESTCGSRFGYATKAIRRKVEIVAACILKQASILRSDQRKIMAMRMLQDERLDSSFEPLIGNPHETIVKHSMVEKIRDGLQEVKRANSNDKMIVGENGKLKHKEIASKILKVQVRNMHKAAKRRERMSLWALGGRHSRSDKLDAATK